MKKSVKVAGIVLGAGLLLGTGSLVGASATDWKTNAINDSYSGFLEIASDKVGELTSNTDADIQNKIDSELESTVTEQEQELQKLLDEYYQMKLDGLTSDNPEVKALEDQIKTIRQNVYEAYKAKIDEAFQGK